MPGLRNVRSATTSDVLRQGVQAAGLPSEAARATLPTEREDPSAKLISYRRMRVEHPRSVQLTAAIACTASRIASKVGLKPSKSMSENGGVLDSTLSAKSIFDSATDAPVAIS